MNNDGKPRVNIGLAIMVSAVILGAAILAYSFSPTAKAFTGSEACSEAAAWHLERATVDDPESSYHYRAGQAYLLLKQLGESCEDWKETP